MNRSIPLLCAALLASPCWGATSCRFVSGGTLAFGSYNIFAATPNDTLVNVSVSCFRSGGQANVTLTLGLGAGSYANSASARRMQQIGGMRDSMSYGLYRDVARSSVWGWTNGVDTVSKVLFVPNNRFASTTFTIYGRIPAGQDVAQGTYADSVLMTLSP